MKLLLKLWFCLKQKIADRHQNYEYNCRSLSLFIIFESIFREEIFSAPCQTARRRDFRRIFNFCSLKNIRYQTFSTCKKIKRDKKLRNELQTTGWARFLASDEEEAAKVDYEVCEGAVFDFSIIFFSGNLKNCKKVNIEEKDETSSQDFKAARKSRVSFGHNMIQVFKRDESR